MYEDFYQLTSDPFRLSPDHRFCFTHSSYGKAKAYMNYALHRAEGFVMLTGKPGTGKTTLVNELLDHCSPSKYTVGNIVSTQLEADDLLRMVAFSFRLTGDLSDKATIIEEVKSFLTRQRKEGRHALLIVDEAQDLSISAMEELRLLTNLQLNNQPLLQVFLVGQEELQDLLLEPRMEQGHQRIVAACHLEPLKEEEIEPYIRHRLSTAGWTGNPQISKTIFPIIHKFGHGIPRKINRICSRLFLYAFVEELQKIGVKDLRIVLTELQRELLITSDLSTYPLLEDDDFFDLEDDYTSEAEQFPDSAPIAEDIQDATAPVLAPEAPRDSNRPADELPVNIEPTEQVDNVIIPIQPATPEDVTQPVLAHTPRATPDRVAPEKAVGHEDRVADPEQHIDSHITSPDKDPARRNRRYWIVALPLAGLLAIAGAYYMINGPLIISVPPGERALEVKVSAPSKPNLQQSALAMDKESLAQKESGLGSTQNQIALPPEQTVSTEPAHSLDIPVTSHLDQQVKMKSEQDPEPISEAKYVDSTEATEDFLATKSKMDDEAGMATNESATDTQPPEPSRIESGKGRTVTTTSDTEPTPVKVQARQILFPYKSMEIQPQFKALLDDVIDELKDSQHAVAKIVGIVDNRGKGSADYNRRVSIQRAQEVTRYLNDGGIAAGRLHVEEDSSHQKDKTFPQPQRVVEVTVLVPTD